MAAPALEVVELMARPGERQGRRGGKDCGVQTGIFQIEIVR